MNQGHINKVMLLIAKRKGMTLHELENEILSEAIERIALSEINDIIASLKREKIGEAHVYEPDDTEIESEIDNELDVKGNGK